MTALSIWPLIGAVLLSGGCALLGKSDALAPRYFSPDLGAPRTPPHAVAIAAAAAPGAESRSAVELRLGRITAASYLGERIVFRNSEYELNFHEDRRWTENPESYLRRALSESLFEGHGLRRLVSGPGPALDVELSELAELRWAPPSVRVRATYTLYDDRVVRREATIVVELPLAPGDPEARSAENTVRVMSRALSQTVQQIVDQVVADLRTPPAVAPREQPVSHSELRE